MKICGIAFHIRAKWPGERAPVAASAAGLTLLAAAILVITVSAMDPGDRRDPAPLRDPGRRHPVVLGEQRVRPARHRQSGTR